MPLGYYSLIRWRCRTCMIVTMDLPAPTCTSFLYNFGISWKQCRQCQAKSLLRIETLRTLNARECSSQMPCDSNIYLLYFLRPTNLVGELCSRPGSLPLSRQTLSASCCSLKSRPRCENITGAFCMGAGGTLPTHHSCTC